MQKGIEKDQFFLYKKGLRCVKMFHESCPSKITLLIERRKDGLLTTTL